MKPKFEIRQIVWFWGYKEGFSQPCFMEIAAVGKFRGENFSYVGQQGRLSGDAWTFEDNLFATKHECIVKKLAELHAERERIVQMDTPE